MPDEKETPAQKTLRRLGACEGHKCECQGWEFGYTIDGYRRCVCDHTQGVHRVTGEAHAG